MISSGCSEHSLPVVIFFLVQVNSIHSCVQANPAAVRNSTCSNSTRLCFKLVYEIQDRLGAKIKRPNILCSAPCQAGHVALRTFSVKCARVGK